MILLAVTREVIRSDNVLSPIAHQAIILAYAVLLPIERTEANIGES